MPTLQCNKCLLCQPSINISLHDDASSHLPLPRPSDPATGGNLHVQEALTPLLEARAWEASKELCVTATSTPTNNAKRLPEATWCASWHAGYALAARLGPSSGCHVALWHSSGASSRQKLLAVWHASIARQLLRGRCDQRNPASLWTECAQIAHLSWDAVEAALLASGWDLNTVHLDGSGGALDPSPADEVEELGSSRTRMRKTSGSHT